ncbi:hypothetical protein A0257_18565 [Hymenobacter psoromatis]|nr:hypothetical protein A0257_18565 [Hymenobacter psoromatis]
MKNLLILALAILTTTFATSCGKSDTTATLRAVDSAKVEVLTKSFDNWYRYTYYNVLLSRDFKGLDTAGQLLSKRAFLSQLVTGKVLALALGTDHKQPVYQLGSYPGNSDPAIRTTSKQLAEEELSNYNREGQRMPDYKFVDLNGVTYTQASTKGKIVVLKFWYIGCIACVDEFPEINALVDKYQQNKDVLFVSLAMNEAKSLRKFLKGQEVKFSVVPASKSYLVDTLQVREYPTHFILGRDGRIAKVTTKASDLAVALQKEIQSH